jgi:hypothetical protein
MTITLVEVDPTAVRTDESRFPDKDDRLVYEHLRHYCSRFFPLPAIMVTLSGGEPIVTKGHKYLRIARELDHRTIRAVVARDCGVEDVSRFLARRGVRTLDWEAAEDADNAKLCVWAWQVFYFETPLDASIRERFTRDVIDTLTRLQAERLASLQRACLIDPPTDIVDSVHFSERGDFVEFRALVVVGDESWYGTYIGAYSAFSQSHARIVSYQGMRL